MTSGRESSTGALTCTRKRGDDSSRQVMAPRAKRFNLLRLAKRRHAHYALRGQS